MIATTPNNIDAYIIAFPKDIQKLLEQVRIAIQEAAPKAEEAFAGAKPHEAFSVF